mmetsp:Transcript_48557/g.89449  ORF Transcript_48557/g.89449 Transcript_48557/m.89449 type:complete len:331 (-) Transcript_48557:68-1060(-)
MLDSGMNNELVVAEIKESKVLSKNYSMTTEVIYTGLASTILVGCMKSSCKRVAIKVVWKNSLTTDEELLDAATELAIHKQIPPHPNVVQLLACEETSSAFMLVTPYSVDLDLWQLVRFGKIYLESEVRNCAGQMLAGFKHIHDECGLLHGDIKPHNFLLFMVDGQFVVQLCDFGLALFLDKNSGLVPHKGLRGTSGWFAPELLSGEDYGVAVDVFGIGLIIFRMLAGYAPFEPPSNFSMPAEFDERYWSHISTSAQDWLTSALEINATKRGTVQSLSQHPWQVQAIAEPTAEQLAAMSRYGAAPDRSVRFWPVDSVPDSTEVEVPIKHEN